MKTSRRMFLRTLGLAGLWATGGCVHPSNRTTPLLVNDVHSQLNATVVSQISTVRSLEEVRRTIGRASASGRAVCIAGGRHAMGAQQFATDAVLIDTRSLGRILQFDREAGLVEVEAGIQWPELVRFLLKAQRGQSPIWTFAQKQTGANRLSIGGALAANIHGRGLRMKPFISDIESFLLINAVGDPLVCSRTQNHDLFRLVAGGYGLFGLVYSAQLRLVPRRKLRRMVEILNVDELIPAFNEQIRRGCLYGDFQFAIDSRSDDYLRRGVFSYYEPVSGDTPMPARRRKFAVRDWKDLLYLTHAEPGRAFAEYAKYYLASSGQIYWSDLHQFSNYLDDYHLELDRRLRAGERSTEIITEIYVLRGELAQFMGEAAEDFRRNGVVMIYGTIRLIEEDDASFLPWASQPYACVIFNLHTVHNREGLAHSAAAFRRLIDLAIRRRGSFYLTYHKYATREQVAACYPKFPEFLRLKLEHDPEERFQSDWYRHYKRLFAEG